jgi:osmoprotectant transport system permease protein
MGEPKNSTGSRFWIFFCLLLAFMAGIFSEKQGFLEFMRSHPRDIWRLTLQHLKLVFIAGSIAVGLGVPIGILLTRGFMRKYRELLLNLFGICQTVPSLAVIAMSMTYLGIGKKTAIFALIIYGLLPIIRNTVAGLSDVTPVILDAGTGMGMKPVQLLFRVELPNASYIILTGIRTSLVIMVGTAALSFLIGGGGLGDLIFTGIMMLDPAYMLAGAVPTALLAVVMNWFFGVVEQWIISPGLVYNGV